MTELTAVSLFAGIGGFDEAMRRAGIRTTAAVEIDKGCRSVLRRHFPQTELFSDITEVTGDQLRSAGFVPERGILTGGFPCQDLSLAGRRAGLGGARSGLFWHVMRLADELSPRWIVLENVPGLLSAVCTCPGDGTCTANGRAVRCGRWDKVGGKRIFIPDVAHGPVGGACAGGCMPAHGGAMGTVLGALGRRGYGFAYRVLDAQFFGVPQRRERVFIVGCARDRAAPVEVLLEPESSGGNHPAGRETRPDLAGTLGGRAGGGRTTDLDGHGAYVTGTLGTTGPGGSWRVGADEAAAGHLEPAAIPIQDGYFGDKQANGLGLGADGDPAYTLDTTGCQAVATLQGGGRRGHRVDAEGAAGGHLIAVPVAVRGREGGSAAEAGEPGDPAFAVRTPGGGSSYPMVATETPKAFNWRTGGDMRLGYSDRPSALHSAQAPAVQTAMAVRRLTPLECERLQGFPDGWTAGQSDSARYRQLGNAVAVPVAEWVMSRLATLEELDR